MDAPVKPQPKSLIVACSKFFGYKPGSGLKEFKAEFDQLTSADHADLITEFAKIGYTDLIAPPAKA
jgi:hypothetical protein